mmetsp:Transcript_12990/g.17611  ORF Transcript_12990/g.17611 Transcript_12990/m.17611 type:complete len:267 (+) Transcript_12990:1-801(+)
MTQSLSVFNKIWGAGPTAASKFYNLGCRTLDDLRNRPDILTAQQVIGLKYYDDFLTRIPREEIECIGKSIKDVIHTINSDMVMEVCGSYRRGNPTCGDIDLLFTYGKYKDSSKTEFEISSERPYGEVEESDHTSFLKNLIELLEWKGILTENLSFAKRKYCGVCILPPDHRCPKHPADYPRKHRRLDMMVTPPGSWPISLLHFTGSGAFNRVLRYWAKQRGFHLSDVELVRKVSDTEVGPPLKVTCEADVFEHLDVPYKPPHLRIA